MPLKSSRTLFHCCALALAAAVLSQAAQAADTRVRRPLSGMSALDSALGPLPPGTGIDRPFPGAGSVTAPQGRAESRRGDPRGGEARAPDIRNADIRRDNFRREDLEADAKDMHSANRGAAIEDVASRDPRAAAGARARSETAAQANTGPVGGMLLNGSASASNPVSGGGAAAPGTGARSGGTGLSGGSVIGGVAGSGTAGASRW